MELAVEVMRQSIAESRKDGKYSPAVGAVLVKPDGVVETAYRGELREGDHAEFTLLERKNRSTKLDGSSLFATLEPCAPGARSHPKLGCAERIVNARIKKVWIGIEDPDPKVDRKGIEFLRQHGIEVHMFDRDLQQSIREVNKEFISQALQRKSEVKKEKSVTLSSLERTVASTNQKDFSNIALSQYKTVAKIPYPLQSEAFNRILVQQGLLHSDGSKTIPSGFGLLLFGKTPRTLMPQAGLLGTIRYPNGKIETRDFDGPLVKIPEEVETWLKDKLPNIIDRSRMRRKESAELPFELIREAIVNALVHRDYDIPGAKCQLIVTEDTLVVSSPGGPVAPITLEQLQSFNAPMLSRNPVLHYVFAKLELAEERGLGLSSLKSRSSELGLPLPKYAYDAPYLNLTLFRTAEASIGSLSSTVRDSLSMPERKGWQWLAGKGRTKSIQYAGAIQADERTARRHLNRFVELGLVRKKGSGPATEYEVIK